jgi:hypothetical protein
VVLPPWGPRRSPSRLLTVVDGTLCGMTAADAESAHHWPEIEERTVPGAGIVARARCGSCGWVGGRLDVVAAACLGVRSGSRPSAELTPPADVERRALLITANSSRTNRFVTAAAPFRYSRRDSRFVTVALCCRYTTSAGLSATAAAVGSQKTSMSASRLRASWMLRAGATPPWVGAGGVEPGLVQAPGNCLLGCWDLLGGGRGCRPAALLVHDRVSPVPSFFGP